MVASLDGAPCPRLGATESIGWIIGPEGGLTDEEMLFCSGTLDAAPVSFGSTILRFDTAAVAAATLTLDRRRTKREGK